MGSFTASILPIMTPEQAANEPINSPIKRNWLFSAAVKELHEFIHIGMSRALTQPEYELAKTALQVRLAEEAAQSAEKLTGQTDRLVSEVQFLVGIASEQKDLSVKLEKQTNALIKLTKVPAASTVVLVILGMVQIYIMLKEDAATNVQHIQASQHEQQPPTNN